MPTDKELSAANGDAFRKRIVILGTGPVALFTAYCLNHSTMNEVILLGRPESKSVDKLVESGRLMLNTKTIRDSYAMIHGTYKPTPNDPDISVEYPDHPLGRAVQNGDVLVSKFEKMGLFGTLAANAIRQRGNGPLTNDDLNEFTAEHFEMHVERLKKDGLFNSFNSESPALRPIYATTDAELIGQSADLVVTAIKAQSLNAESAQIVKGLLKPGAPVLVAANGINTTLLPPDNDRATRPLRKALQEIPALVDSAAFTSSIEEDGHQALGASITFALQLGTDMEKDIVNHNPKAGDMIFSSKVHEAFLTVPEDPTVKEVFEGTPLTVYRQAGTDYTKEVLTKLAKNLMNVMCAGLSKTKAEIIQNPRYRAAYADAVGELYNVANAYGVTLASSRSTFVERSIAYHESSIGEGGHKSSTVVDIEKGRKTEAPFLIDSLEQLADEQNVDIHMLRILRRCLKSVEEQNTPEKAFERGQELARNIILEQNGRATQFRRTDHKASVTSDDEDPQATEGRPSGTYFRIIEPWSYRYGMNPDTALYLIKKRIEGDLEAHRAPDEVFYNELLQTFHDRDSETGFIKEFEPLEELLIDRVANFAPFIDNFLRDKNIRHIAPAGVSAKTGTDHFEM